MHISMGKNKWIMWVLATLAVILIYQFVYGLASLRPSNISWLMTVRHDWGTHYLGWAFYKNEPWHFPIGKVTGYNYPVGTNVGFTDSIPLLAIFFKLFAPLLSDDFQYFGIWLFLCHLLAGYYTILLFRLFKVNWVITMAAIVFVVTNPVLVYRGMHPALCGQWMLIAGIYYYFLNIRTSNWRKILLYQFILLAFSSLINPYLCWMVLGFSFATPIKLCFYEKLISRNYLIAYLAISLIGVWLLWYMTGMVSFEKKEGLGVSGAYGLYALNLNSLYNPGGFSSILPQLKWVSWHQYEGYMYLGVGMLALLSVFILYRGYILVKPGMRKAGISEKVSTKNRSLIPLVILAICYAIFSITLVFTFNDKVLFSIPAPGFFKQLEEIFRASARFFWMPYYLIILFTIIGIAKSKISPLISSSLIVLALVIQLYDIKLLLTSKEMTYGGYKPPMDNTNWIRLMEQFDEIIFFPAFESPKIRSMDYQDFSFLALKAGKPVNLAYVARSDPHAMQLFSDSLTTAVESGKLSPGALYITNASFLEHFSLVLQSNTAHLSELDGCFFLYAKAGRNGPVDSLVSRWSAKNKSKQDSVLRAIGTRKEFTETARIPVKDSQAIRYNLESVSIGTQVISMQGWAFIESTQNNAGDSVFITLTSVDKTYIARAVNFQRPDITGAFARRDLSNSGLKFLAFMDTVQSGRYQVGIAIKDVKGRFVYQNTGKVAEVKVP